MASTPGAQTSPLHACFLAAMLDRSGNDCGEEIEFMEVVLRCLRCVVGF
jgi:hypothetical protein